MLIKAGADLNLKTNKGLNALDIAQGSNCDYESAYWPEAVELIKKYSI